MPCSRAGGRPTRGARLGPGAGWARLRHDDYSRVHVCFPRTPLFRPCFGRRASPEKPAWEGAPPELCCPIVLLQGRNPSSADLDHQEPSTASWPTALPVVTPAEIIIAAFKALSLSLSPTALGPVLPAPQYAAPAHMIRADRFSHWVSGGGAQSHSCLFHGSPSDGWIKGRLERKVPVFELPGAFLANRGTPVCVCARVSGGGGVRT